MKKKTVLSVIILTVTILAVTILISGCSTISKLNPFKKGFSVPEKAYEQTKKFVEPQEQPIADINNMTDQMVEKINAGNWEEAIGIGENANTLVARETAKTTVKESVYTLISVKEKLFETLIEAYDYKNHLAGLSKEEKERYVRTARSHYNLNPSDPFKKQALARVLIETENYAEGLKLAGEVYSVNKNKDVTDTYAWGLNQTGKKVEAYEIYKNFFTQAETLVQVYHAAVVIEEQDKALGLKLYKGCQKAANNLMVKEENTKNQSAQSYINMISGEAQKAIDRLFAGGSGVDSQYKVDYADNIVNSIVKL